MASRGFDLGIGACLALIICFGMVGNIISFLVWTKGKRCRNLPGGIYLRALAIADSVVLCVSAADRAAGLLFEVRPRNLNNILCKFETTMFHFGIIVSTWIVVCFTAERTIAVYQVKTSTRWLNKTTTVSIITCIAVITLLLNLPYAVGCKLMMKSDGKYNHATVVTSNIDISDVRTTGNVNHTTSFEYCGADSSSFIYKYERGYHFWLLDFVLIFSVPLTFIIISNVTVLYVITCRRNEVKMKSDSRRNAITARALSVSLVHCVSSAPFSIAVLVPGFVENAFARESGHDYYVGVFVSLCTFLNHGVNFILYSFFGTDFRRDTGELFGKKMGTIRPETSALNNSCKDPQHDKSDYFLKLNSSDVNEVSAV